jgi:hypothetical protein
MNIFHQKNCLFIAVFYIFTTIQALSQEVFLPDTTIETNTTVVIPLRTNNITGLGIISYDCTILYNPSLIEYAGFDKNGTLSASATVVVNSQTPGELIIGAAQVQPMQGSGVLLYFTFRSKNRPGTALFFFQSFTFSSPQFPGEQRPAITQDGKMYIVSPTIIAMFPNPFSASITFLYKLQTSARTEFIIYDITGKKVKTLWNGAQSAGNYSLYWNGLNDSGVSVCSGIYICRIIVGNYKRIFKIARIK